MYWCKNQEVRRIPVCKDQRWNLLLNVCVCDLPALAHKKPEQDGRSRTYGASQTLSVISRHDCVINCCLRLNHVQMKANSQFTATDFRSSKTEIKLVETCFCGQMIQTSKVKKSSRLNVQIQYLWRSEGAVIDTTWRTCRYIHSVAFPGLWCCLFPGSLWIFCRTMGGKPKTYNWFSVLKVLME